MVATVILSNWWF